MSGTPQQTGHPYVIRNPSLARGAPVVAGTKFPVRSVVQYVIRQGITPEEMIEEFPQLSLPKIYDALSYYYDHREEIDQEIVENAEASWREPIKGPDDRDPTLPG